MVQMILNNCHYDEAVLLGNVPIKRFAVLSNKIFLLHVFDRMPYNLRIQQRLRFNLIEKGCTKRKIRVPPAVLNTSPLNRFPGE
jgi:hypothetical protein